jgi:DNA-binding transcriptional LysR family regulator
LRIACSHSLAQTALARAVGDFLARYPRLVLELQVDNRAVNLVEQRIDLALRITNALDLNMIARRLADCDSVVCAAPSYLAAHGNPQSAAELAGHNCLTYSYFGRSEWEFTHQGEALAVPVGGNLSANESMALLAATVEGVGISLQPRFAAAPLVEAGQLIVLLPEYQPQRMGVYGLYMSREHMPPTLRVLLDHLVAWFASEWHAPG